MTEVEANLPVNAHEFMRPSVEGTGCEWRLALVLACGSSSSEWGAVDSRWLDLESGSKRNGGKAQPADYLYRIRLQDDARVEFHCVPECFLRKALPLPDGWYQAFDEEDKQTWLPRGSMTCVGNVLVLMQTRTKMKTMA